MKIVSLSFDDGTIYDLKFIELLNKYNLKATLNLNSELKDFVWYYSDSQPIARLDLEKVKDHLVETIYFSKNYDEEGLLPKHKEEIKEVLKKDNRIKKYVLGKNLTK